MISSAPEQNCEVTASRQVPSSFRYLVVLVPITNDTDVSLSNSQNIIELNYVVVDTTELKIHSTEKLYVKPETTLTNDRLENMSEAYLTENLVFEEIIEYSNSLRNAIEQLDNFLASHALSEQREMKVKHEVDTSTYSSQHKISHSMALPSSSRVIQLDHICTAAPDSRKQQLTPASTPPPPPWCPSHVHSTCLVTDGQCPLRQLLHPCACSSRIRLPDYYWRFFDLRKVFAYVYGTTADESSAGCTIQFMLEYLKIDPYKHEDEGFRKVKDIAHIILQVIADGYTFEQPEFIQSRFSPGVCLHNENIDDNCVVKARGLPWQASDQDIADFFRGLNIAKGGIALCLSVQGRRNGEALVRFENEEHRNMALKRHKRHIANRYIEIYKSNGAEFISIAGGLNSEALNFLEISSQVIIRMRGLPYDCSADQVVDFFSNGDSCTACEVMNGKQGVLFVRKGDGRATGDAFVQFEREDDLKKVLSRHRNVIGTRYIELFRSTPAEVQQVLNRSMDLYTHGDTSQLHLTTLAHQQQSQASQQHLNTLSPVTMGTNISHHTLAAPTHLNIIPHSIGPPHLHSAHNIVCGQKRDCVRLRGLPFEAQVEHILQFLGDLASLICVHGVHMVINSQGNASGEAFIQLISEEAAYLVAKQRDHQYMSFAGKKQRYIEVFQCSGDDMNLVVHAANLNLSPPMMHQQPTTGAANFMVGTSSPASVNGLFPPVSYGMFAYTPATQAFQLTPTPLHPPANGYAATVPHASSISAPIPSPFYYWPSAPVCYPSPPVSPTNIPHNYYCGMAIGSTAVAPPIGSSVVNQGHLISPEAIHIHHNMDGQPSGEAYMAFTPQIEAESALNDKQNQHIGSRYIELFMVS